MGAVYERFLAHGCFGRRTHCHRRHGGASEKRKAFITRRIYRGYIVAQRSGEKIKAILAEALALVGYKNYQAAAAKFASLPNASSIDLPWQVDPLRAWSASSRNFAGGGLVIFVGRTKREALRRGWL